MGRGLLIILAVLIAATVGIYASYVHDLTAARARLVGRSKTMPTSFGTMEYALVGQGEPMLIVHGAEGGFDQSIDMTGELASSRISAHRSVSFWLPSLDFTRRADDGDAG
jgi:hypothetical protein